MGVFGRRVGGNDEMLDLDSIVLTHIERAMLEEHHVGSGGETDPEMGRSPLSASCGGAETSESQDSSLQMVNHSLQNTRYRRAMRVTSLLGYYRQSSWDL